MILFALKWFAFNTVPHLFAANVSFLFNKIDDAIYKTKSAWIEYRVFTIQCFPVCSFYLHPYTYDVIFDSVLF